LRSETRKRKFTPEMHYRQQCQEGIEAARYEGKEKRNHPF